MPEPTYPGEVRYHEEHDWALIKGDEAAFGITWYALDTLGEVVFYAPPEVGAGVQKDASYAEVVSTRSCAACADASLGRSRAPTSRTRSPRSRRPTPTSTAAT